MGHNYTISWFVIKIQTYIWLHIRAYWFRKFDSMKNMVSLVAGPPIVIVYTSSSSCERPPSTGLLFCHILEWSHALFCYYSTNLLKKCLQWPPVHKLLFDRQTATMFQLLTKIELCVGTNVFEICITFLYFLFDRVRISGLISSLQTLKGKQQKNSNC